MPPTFRERYCAHHRIPLAAFEDHLLPRGLHFPARVLRAVRVLPREHFLPEREFLRNISTLRSRRLFWAEAEEFLSLKTNRRVARRFLHLRLSTERVRRHMEECWAAIHAKPSSTPFSRHTGVVP